MIPREPDCGDVRTSPCPLCGHAVASLMWTGNRKMPRDFFLCHVCDLVHVDPSQFVSAQDEMRYYLLHENLVDDPSYRRFLERLYVPLRPELTPGASGLDFGAGTGPALAAMMREDGFDIRIYDPFFHPYESVLKERYDFITCTETAEHFHHPAREFPRLIGMLRPGGLLAVMTGMLEDRSRFPGWHYHRDPTHVMFYSEITMRWIAQWLGLGTSFPAPNVTFFRRPV